MSKSCLPCVAWAVVLSAVLCATGCGARLSAGDAKALAEAKAFLAGGGDVKAVYENGRSRMRHAVWNGHLETMRFLITNGADLKERGPLGYHLVHAAALQGHFEAMKLLFEHGAKIEARSDGGKYTALHFAAWAGDIDAVRFLVLHKADINAKAHADDTPIFFAAASGAYEVVEFLISRRASATARTTGGIEPLRLAAGGRGLMQTYGYTGTFSVDPEATAAGGVVEKPYAWYEGDHDKVIRLLVKNGADVNRALSGTTPLHEASGTQNVRAVEALLELGADPSLRTDDDVWIDFGLGRPSYSALDYAVDSGIAFGPEQKGGKLVKALIRAGAKVNQHDGTGKTPLHHAAANLHFEAIRVLLKAGADINGVDKKFVRKHEKRAIVIPGSPGYYRHRIGKLDFGQTPLFIALKADRVREYYGYPRTPRLKVIKLLLDKGADTAAKLPDGATPLHIAVLFANSEEIIELLLAHGADINATDKKSATPLHYAAARDWSWGRIRREGIRRGIVMPSLVRMLVRKGASLTARTKSGMTPLDWAMEFDDLEVDRADSRQTVETAKEVIKILKDAAAAAKRSE